MAIESATYISQLDATLPAAGDLKSEGDDHIRLLKSSIKTNFPNLGAFAVTPTAAELNYVAGVTSGIQVQINAEISARTSADNAEISARTSADNAEISARTSADALLAPMASPAFTGTPTAPTPAAGTSNTVLATTAFVTATAFSANLPGQYGHAGHFIKTDGVTPSWASAGAATYLYADRGLLRSLTPGAGDQAIIKDLGLFVWEISSTEPDDDESAFATGLGVWLLQAASWDLVDAWQLVDDAARDEDDEDEPLRFAASFAAKILTGSATCAITSVATVSSASFTGTVTGAAVGDRVVATPPAQLGSDATQTGLLSHHAWVSAANTVTVMLTNASAQAGTTNPAIRTAWPITVIKS